MGGELEAYLARLKACATAGRVTVARRDKNRRSMLEHGLTFEDVVDALLRLEPKHYSKGPSSDLAGFPGEIMEFLLPVASVRFYVKVRLFVVGNGDSVVTISFHEENMYD